MKNFEEYFNKITESNNLYNMEVIDGYYAVIHRHYATDHYEYGRTIVKASSKQDAMDKLNEWISTNPYGVYTPKPCEDISKVYELNALV